jgi:hypothetical protein
VQEGKERLPEVAEVPQTTILDLQPRQQAVLAELDCFQEEQPQRRRRCLQVRPAVEVGDF